MNKNVRNEENDEEEYSIKGVTPTYLVVVAERTRKYGLRAHVGQCWPIFLRW